MAWKMSSIAHVLGVELLLLQPQAIHAFGQQRRGMHPSSRCRRCRRGRPSDSLNRRPSLTVNRLARRLALPGTDWHAPIEPILTRSVGIRLHRLRIMDISV